MTPRIGVLTSGGDAPGMNAAVRAVVRGALTLGAQPYAILEGWQGAVDGGDRIREMTWSDVSSILEAGGTVIGTARSADFRERAGRRRAVRHLLELGIDRLVVIGGDGSLSGADVLRQEWRDLLGELIEAGELAPEVAHAHAHLQVVGLVGSIDNDLVGTDISIGADSALHRIVDAIDQITSTAASHQRTFVIEVMGRQCGYLALMGAVAGGCDYVLVPERPPQPGWAEEMVRKLEAGRAAGRRESIVLVAEGARDHDGRPLGAQAVADVLRAHSGEEPRVTILGHVQRGGTPSAYDRWMPSVLGYTAVQEILAMSGPAPAAVLGVQHNRVARVPLVDAVARTREVARLEEEGDSAAIAARGRGFGQMLQAMDVLSQPPGDVAPSGTRIAIVHGGGLAPGLNAAVRAAVRLGVPRGHTMLGVEGGFPGLAEGAVHELDWQDVDGWGLAGGAELGTRHAVPEPGDVPRIAETIERHRIDALLVIGGYNAYLAAHTIDAARAAHPALQIPIACVPASIDNNLPGTELSIGADTALNNAVWAADRIKESASASRRCCVVETMGRHCGYLAQQTGLAAGAELVYTHEKGVSLAQVAQDAARMRQTFLEGRRLFLVIRNEEANPRYNLSFMARAFEEEGRGLFDVRTNAIGHLQQGGPPSPFDRLLATRLVQWALQDLDDQLAAGTCEGRYVGFSSNDIGARPLARMLAEVDEAHQRPREQWWRQLEVVQEALSFPGAPVAGAVPVLTPT